MESICFLGFVVFGFSFASNNVSKLHSEEEYLALGYVKVILRINSQNSFDSKLYFCQK